MSVLVHGRFKTALTNELLFSPTSGDKKTKGAALVFWFSTFLFLGSGFPSFPALHPNSSEVERKIWCPGWRWVKVYNVNVLSRFSRRPSRYQCTQHLLLELSGKSYILKDGKSRRDLHFSRDALNDSHHSRPLNRIRFLRLYTYLDIYAYLQCVMYELRSREGILLDQLPREYSECSRI